MFSEILSLWRPIVEILLIWALIYWLLRFFMGTRVVQVLIGLVILALLFNVAKVLGLNTVIWVLSKLFAVGVVAFLIIFQPEMRRGLARIGQKTMGHGGMAPESTAIDEIVRAVQELARRKHGSLIAFERGMSIRQEVEGGTDLDAQISADLLISIFDPHTPTHDGGVIIANRRIVCCGAFFPLSNNPDLPPSLGTRHRAALGLTEESDAICVVVSEETSQISIAEHGRLSAPLEVSELRQRLREVIEIHQGEERRRSILDLFARRSGGGL